MVDTFLHDCLESLQRVCPFEIMVRTDENGATLMGSRAHSLGHLLLCFYLHIHISCTGLDGTYQPLFRYLHGLDLAALLRQSLKSGLRSSHFSHAACSYQRHIRRKYFLSISGRKITPVQTDFSHLTLLQCLKYLSGCLILYCCTNHILNLQAATRLPLPPCHGLPHLLLHAEG